jgi:hypothetical protein
MRREKKAAASSGSLIAVVRSCPNGAYYACQAISIYLNSRSASFSGGILLSLCLTSIKGSETGKLCGRREGKFKSGKVVCAALGSMGGA